ncbi:hypothetical protein C8F04DRAFT_624110 [Mycena alexandri]|uniref:Uncharacterized protein n=1 Tax=Mycena alexandri TaxID=1745969 RepID=A0AAD6SVX3_9AGAR|nr:hypothetical protein C8F04DRAFT_624110 [Mycena alexandri]
MMTDTERLEVMDSQRFDVSRRGTNGMNLSIQTGLTGDASASSSRSGTPEGAWDSFTSSANASGSALSTPPTSVNSSLTLQDDDATNPKTIRQTDVFDKGTFLSTRTIIRPIPRSPIPAFFSRPSSPANSRPSSPLPINFGALNCFSNAAADAFTEQVDYIQAQRAREIDGLADVEVHVHQVVTTKTEAPWFVQKIVDPEGLRRRALYMEPRGSVSCA